MQGSAIKIDLSNVQAIVSQLYRCPISRHLLFRFGDPDGTRTFLKELIPRVTTADLDGDSLPDPLLNLGITFGGLVALGLDQALLAKFDVVFKAGPDPIALGDTVGSRSDPATWWEEQFTTQDVHCLVHLYFHSDDAVEPASADIRAIARRSGVAELIPRSNGTVLDGRSLGGAKLHFGYRDGISHPDICWNDEEAQPGQINFRNFLLGYANAEFGSAPFSGPAAELVRDSSYAAFRWIYQDVATFNRFLRDKAPRLYPHLPSADAEELLAAKMMGRWRNGTPLVLAPDQPDAMMTNRNDFAYAAQDPHGHRCPFSAHIRVVNPRDQQLELVVEGVPRVLRRGMPYGPELDSTEDDGQDRGLIGIFLCADLRRQIYTLTSWIKRNDFSPVFEGNRRRQDPLVGNRHVPGSSSDFLIPSETGPVVLQDLPDFIHTKGTAFCLLPSKSTLYRLMGGAGSDQGR